MIQFEPITLDLQEEYKRRTDNIRLSYYRFVNIFMSRNCTYYRYAMVDDALCVASLAPGQKPNCMFPLGAKDLCRTLSLLRETLGDFTLLPMTAAMAGQLEMQCPGRFHVSAQRDYFDYVYETQALIQLAGKAYHGKRNFVNRFTSRYDYTYVPLHQDNVHICLPLMEKWFADHPGYQSTFYDERQALGELIQNYNALGVKGAAIQVGEEIVGFTFGECMCPDTAHIVTEKANTDYPGIYPVLNQEFLKHEWAFTQYVNREEDMGLEGLRKAKLSYHPAFFGEVYLGTLA